MPGVEAGFQQAGERPPEGPREDLCHRGPDQSLRPPGRGHVAHARRHSALVSTHGTVSKGIHATKRGHGSFTAEATPTRMIATRNSSAVKAILRDALMRPS